MSKTKKIQYEGKYYSYRELSEVCGIPWNTLYARVNKQNMTVKQAVEKPNKKKEKRSQDKDKTANEVFNKYLSIGWK